MIVFFELVFDNLFFGVERGNIVEPERADRRPDELFFGDARALGLFFEVVAAGHEEGLLGDETDELAARHPETELPGQLPGLVEDDVDGRDHVVREVDRDLGHPVILDVPADRLDFLELARHLDRVAAPVLDDVPVLVPLGPTALPEAQGDLVGQLPVPGVEVDVVGDQELAGADDGGAGLGVENGPAEIGRPAAVLEFLGQAFVFPGPDRGQVPALRRPGGGFVEIDGDPQLSGDPGAKLASQPDAVLHGHARDRDEGADVRGPDTAVGTLVDAHVDDLRRLGDGPEGGLLDGFGCPDERHNGPVRGRPRVDVEQFDAGDGFDLADDGLDLLRVPAFAEIGHALDEFHLSSPLRRV